MNRKKILASILISPLFLSVATPVFAFATPDFGSCVNPQGQQIVSYNSGIHGVAGRTDTYTGSDAVYQQSGNGLTQCLCTDSGNGIQTNWLKASTLSSSDIAVLKNEGWLYIVTGSPWGLEDVAYLAKNSEYQCSSAPTPTCTETPTPTPTGTLTPTPTSTPGPTETPTPGPGDTSTPTPAPTGSVLGLASTGDVLFLDMLILAGGASLIAGLLVNRLNKKK